MELELELLLKERLIPEFELKKEKEEKKKKADRKKTPIKKVEEVNVEGDVKVEVVKVEGDENKAKSESEQIAIEAEKMKSLKTMEEDEASMK